MVSDERNDTYKKKAAVRAKWRVARSSISLADRLLSDEAILENILSLSEFDSTTMVLSYLSFGTEVDTHGIIDAAWRQGKEVALPHTVKKQHRLRFYRIDDLDGLQPGPFGGLEPKCEKKRRVHTRSATDAICIVPGVVFDRRGNHLGYGGGYYDNFIDRFAGTTIGVCRDATLSKRKLPVEGHDRKVDILVTDSCVLRFS